MSRSKGGEDPHQEAVAILTRARHRAEPHKLTEHVRRAAAALLDSVFKVASVASEAGYEIRVMLRASGSSSARARGPDCCASRRT